MDAGLIKILRGYSFRSRTGASQTYQRISFSDNDPADGIIWKKYFFEADPQTANTDTGNLLLSGVAPSVAVSDNKTASTQTGQLVLNGVAPSVQTPVSVYPAQGNLILTGISPDVIASDNKLAVTQTGDLVLLGVAPVVSVSSGVAATLTGNLIINSFRPQAFATGFATTNVVNATITQASEFSVDSTIITEPVNFVNSTISEPVENII